MTIYDLMIVFVIVCFGIVIWQNAGYRDRVIRIAKQHCEHHDVQLLDDGVGLKRMRLSKDKRGNIAVQRTYEFEFTATGEQRHQGTLVMHGQRLEKFELAVHRFQVH